MGTPLHTAVLSGNADGARLLRQKRPLWESKRNCQKKVPAQCALSEELRMVMGEKIGELSPRLNFRPRRRRSSIKSIDLLEVPIQRPKLTADDIWPPGLCCFVAACGSEAICKAFLKPSNEDKFFQRRSKMWDSHIGEWDLEPISVATKEPILAWRSLSSLNNQYTVGIREQAVCSHLGAGAYGLVWLARNRKNNSEFYAVKNISTVHTGNAMIAQCEWEFSHRVHQIPHPCIVELFIVYQFVADHLCMLVMEYCPCGTLLDRIRVNAMDPIYHPPEFSLKWLSQVFLGMEHLHLANLILRDLKPDNVVLDSRNRAKLTDFGLGRFGAEAPAVSSFGLPTGTPGYMSPEILQKQKMDAKTDLYSYGVLMWMVLTGGLVSTSHVVGGPHPPSCLRQADSLPRASWNDNERLKWCVDSPARFDARPVHSLEGKQLILLLIQKVPARRPGCLEIRSSNLFAELSPHFPPQGMPYEDVDTWLCAHGF